MAVFLEKKLFAGDRELTPNELAKLEIRNSSSDVYQKLTDFGWKEQAIACVGLALSADNQRVENGAFLPVGKLPTLRENASKIWSTAATNVTLSVSLPNADIFTFSNGNLASDYVSGGALEHGFFLDGKAVLEADYESHGLGGFCIRMTCQLGKSTVKTGVVIQYAILLFPLTKEDLLTRYPMAIHASWPGLIVQEGEMPLMPRPSTVWGCPIWPLLLTTTPIVRGAAVVGRGALHSAVAGIMQRTVVPSSAKTGAALATRWRQLAVVPEELTDKRGAVEWPAPTASPTVPGNE